MIEQINKWLSDPKREYAFGLSVFNQLASSDMKNKYGAFLNVEAPENVKSTDARFPMLINKITSLLFLAQTNPSAFLNTPLFNSPKNDVDIKVKQIVQLNEEKAELERDLVLLEESDEEKTAELEDLQYQLDDKDDQIDELRNELEKKGLKVVTGEDLPVATKGKHERIKQIIPLMAKVHAELSDTTLTDEIRVIKAKELCDLDDERRTLWDDIDKYLSDSDTILPENKENEYSKDPVVRGMQIASRMKRCEENIKRNTRAITKHVENNNPNKEAKARALLKQYQEELDSLKLMLNDSK